MNCWARRARPLGFAFFCLLLATVSMSSCTGPYRRSLGGETDQNFSRIYRTDFNTAWQAVLDALKNSRLDVSNREAGFIQTRWVDNTAEKNLIDSYGQTDTYLKTQYRFRVTVAQGAFEGRPSVKVTVRKEQVVSRDVLEGFQKAQTDSVEENTLLYRIGRIIFMRMKLALIEEQRTQQAIGADPMAAPLDEPPMIEGSDGADLDPELN